MPGTASEQRCSQRGGTKPALNYKTGLSHGIAEEAVAWPLPAVHCLLTWSDGQSRVFHSSTLWRLSWDCRCQLLPHGQPHLAALGGPFLRVVSLQCGGGEGRYKGMMALAV
jgi:hypothetical protein